MGNTIKLKEQDLVRIINKVMNEQQTPTVGNAVPTSKPRTGAMTAANKPQVPVQRGGGNYGPYCKIGTSQGIIKQHTVGTSGPNVNMGETGFGLFDNTGKLICKISTKYTQGGYIATSSK